MPLHIDIKINNTLLHTINIGRIAGGTSPDDLNTYRALITKPGETVTDYYGPTSVEFMHRYGDGADLCVARAIHALTYETSSTWVNTEITTPDEHGSAYIDIAPNRPHSERQVEVTAILDISNDNELLGVELLGAPPFHVRNHRE
jgi:Protein of unknown function (DUF2283)